MAAPSGTVWGNIVTGSKSTRKGRIGIYAGVSSTNTQTTVSIQVWFWSMYSVSDSSNSYYYNANASSATTLIGSKTINHTVASGSGWSTSNQTLLGSYSYTYNRGTSAATKYYAAKFTGIDSLNAGNIMTVTTKATIPALASYKVTYNANGGSGAPSAQTKWYGTTLKLSTNIPSRAGYTFQGWATSSSGSVAYAAGANYTANASVTLYAKWKAKTYSVTYNANGGTGAPAAQTKTHGVTLKLSTAKPTKGGYNFKGWSLSHASNASVDYASGASYTTNAALKLYAVWEKTYAKPRITNVNVHRGDSSGAASDYGTYIKIKFSWACDNPYERIHYSWCKNNGDSGESAEFLPNGTSTSGEESEIVGDGQIDPLSSYKVTILVADSIDETEIVRTVPTITIPLDILAHGEGIAFGKTAEMTNTVESRWRMVSSYNDVAFSHIHPDTGYGISFGVGGSGKNRGVWDRQINQWILYSNQDNIVRLKGNSDLYVEGTKVHLTSNDYVMIKSPKAGNTERAYGVNAILWSGAYYMTAGHTATLSSAVSNQPHGIILVFSEYINGASSNTAFHTRFIPKQMVASHGGAGHCIQLSSSNLAYFGTKYLYIHDTKIVGNDNNILTGASSSGITRACNRFIMRYVIGV